MVINHWERNPVILALYPIQKQRIGQLVYLQSAAPMRAKPQESDKRKAK